MVHLDGLDFGGHTSGGEGNDHTGLDDTSLNTTDRDCANTTNLVHVLKGKTEGLVGGARRRLDGVDSLDKGLSGVLALLGLTVPAYRPVSNSIRTEYKNVLPLYQGQLVEASIMLSPWKPEMGTKATVLGLYPTFLMKLETSLTISS